MHMNCICRASLKMTNEYEEKQHGEISIQSDSRGPVLSCWSCGEKHETDNVNQNGPSRTPSLTSTNSAISCSSDVSVDTNPCNRGQNEGSSDSGREDLKVGPNPVNGIHQFDEQKLKDSGVRNGNCTDSPNSVFKSAGLDTNEDEGDSFKGEMDAQVWLPPEAEDPEEDAENSVVSYDDDEDECDDGTKWSKTSSFSSSGEEGSGSYRFREEKQKAMDEVMNGKFKALVGQLLNSIGVSYLGENGESWVDIVTSLSWEAASFVKPDATQGKPMDPDGYVKIKCVATGSRSQSQVIRGLVFKKHAAHKHMPTKYVKPRLLLIRGALGLSSSGLSSFESMQQEKDSQKSIVEMIEMSHPNVILVEKTVPRDIQESILARGMTLVFDMKLHRLERVARCTGSSILSSDILAGQKLKHCDSFHFEKFTEEHNKSSEAGKKPSRTLMFIEGCPTRLGCTILLKGTHSDELKRIKCVMQCAVVMAYHLILETSFLLDQSAMFSTIPFDGVPSVSPEAIQPNNSKSSHIDDPRMETICPSTVDIPVSEGFHGGGSSKLNLDFEDNSPFLYEPYNPVVLSGLTSLSVSLKKAFGDSFPQFSSSPSDNQKDCEALVNCDLEIKNNSDEEKVNCDLEIKSNSDEEKAYDEESSPTKSEDQKQHNGNISTVLDSESILVLMSSRNASRGTICEQSHLSHIKFYRNFDVPLGKFLQENLLNQKLQCSTCGEPPEAHFYYYAHHNKQLTIQVRHLPIDERLPGESVGKLWMWSRCGKCKSYHNGNNGHSKSTKRVLISTAARGLSFGKFLELSFSNYSSFSRLSSCGHSLHRDFLYFFGLGRMVAMMRYSQVRTYSVSLPPLMLEINHSIREELLKRETAHLHSKAMHLFDEVEKSLGDVAPRYSGSTLKLSGKLEFSDVEEILKQERSQFEINLENAVVKSGHPEEAVYKLLSLNRFLCDLLLESCIWDQRLYALLSTDSIVMDAKTVNFETQGKTYSKEDEITVREADREINVSETRNKSLNNGSTSKILQEESIDPKMVLIQDIPIEGSNELSTSTNYADDNEKSNPSACHNAHSSNGDSNNVPKRDPSHFPLLPASDSMKRRAWTSFLEFREEYLRDLHRGFVPKFDNISSYTMECFPNALGLINEEGLRLHIPLGTDEYMVTDFEDELSSIIACALALLKDPPTPTESLNEDANKENRVALVKVNERSPSLMRISSSLSSAHWSSNGSFDPDGTRSPPSLEESRLSSFDGLNLLDSLVSSGALHPEVSMGFGKSQKGKYSVLCSYANQFQDLRNRCCPSETDYIASLSRCRNWDAKGGKSKSFFAKTLDDRFIIKEIKKTEFESFTQFAPDYFRYMNECYEKGNQTCLAKILGIYQVTIRQTKSGKEVKHDLMVMENLSFGRNITRQYDLKGALHARFTLAADGSGDVLLDQNFVNDMNASPLYVGTKSKRILERSVWNDTTFLNSINVMDYSLLVSVDAERHELVCGIIDYLRQYTWDKQLETWVKSSLVLPKNQLPTIVSPHEYKKRFRKFMTTYFLTVPDHWCLQRSSNPCKLCGMGEPNDYLR